MPIDSPCVGVCKIHPTYKVCAGCLRSDLEIRQWSVGDDTTKLKILKNLERKKKIYKGIAINSD